MKKFNFPCLFQYIVQIPNHDRNVQPCPTQTTVKDGKTELSLKTSPVINTFGTCVAIPKGEDTLKTINTNQTTHHKTEVNLTKKDYRRKKVI